MPWTDLPPELLHLIARRLHDPSDFLHLRAVCRSWRDAAAAGGRPPQFLPWLLGIPKPSLAGETAAAFGPRPLYFYSLFSGAGHALPPVEANLELMGPGFGHLLVAGAAGDRTLAVNPVAGETVVLPPRPYWEEESFGCVPNPFTGDDAVAFIYSERKFAFCRPAAAATAWTELAVPSFTGESAFYTGNIYLGRRNGDVAVLDGGDLSELAVIPPPQNQDQEERFTALVPSPAGLLRVARRVRRRGAVIDEELGFEVYELEMENRRWARRRSIGERVLFMGLYHGFCLLAKELEGVAGGAGDEIYFFKVGRCERGFIYRYRMADGAVEELPGPWMHGGTWLVPML